MVGSVMLAGSYPRPQTPTVTDHARTKIEVKLLEKQLLVSESIFVTDDSWLANPG